MARSQCPANARCRLLLNSLHYIQVEVQEAYGKQNPQRYPLGPPDPKLATGEDASTHNRGMGGPLAKLPLSVQPGEVLVQVSSQLFSTVLGIAMSVTCTSHDV